MHSVRENQSDNNNDYQQGISLINAGNNSNQWSDKSNNAGDNNEIEFVDGDYQDSQQNQLHQPNQQNQYDQPNQEERGEGLNESRPTFSLDHSNSKHKGRKKASSQPLTEGNSPYNQPTTNANANVNTISFSLTLAELAKLSAIATILGYEDLSLFARELVLKGVEPYFERASQAVKAEHFG